MQWLCTPIYCILGHCVAKLSRRLSASPCCVLRLNQHDGHRPATHWQHSHSPTPGQRCKGTQDYTACCAPLGRAKKQSCKQNVASGPNAKHLEERPDAMAYQTAQITDGTDVNSATRRSDIGHGPLDAVCCCPCFRGVSCRKNPATKS